MGVNLHTVLAGAINGRITVCLRPYRDFALVGGRYDYYTHHLPVWLYRRKSFPLTHRRA